MTTSMGMYQTDVTYKLPSTVEALRDGWISTFQTAAAISALFAVVESQLLRLARENVAGGEEDAAGTALLALTYLAFFLFLSTAMSSLVLIDELSSVALRASRCFAADLGNLDVRMYDESSSALLTRFNGGRGSWKWVMWHWIFTLLTGYLSILAQIELYVWSTERTPVKVVSLVFGIFAVLPLFDFIFPSIWCRRTRESK